MEGCPCAEKTQTILNLKSWQRYHARTNIIGMTMNGVGGMPQKGKCHSAEIFYRTPWRDEKS